MGWLDQIDQQIARTFAAKSGKSASAMLDLMKGPGKKDGTEFLAIDAKAIGLVDKVLPLKVKATSNIAARARIARIAEIDSFQDYKSPARLRAIGVN